MKNHKRWALLAVTTVGLSGVLAGCSTNVSESAAGPTKAPITLSIMSWNIALATLKEDAELFHKLHPNVNFQYITEADPPTTYTKLNAELAAGAGVPDIISIETSHAQSFISKFPDAFLNVTSRVKSLKPLFAQSKWPALTGANGQVYGVPWDIGPAMVFYRKDLFKEAGINANDIKTWAQYIAAGKKLVQHFHGKVKMTALNYDDDGLFKMMTNEQGSFYFNAKGQIAVNNQAAMNAVNTEKEMVQAGIGLQVPSANGWNDTITAFSNGQIASQAEGVWYVGTIETSAPDQKGKWGIFPLPAFTENGSHAANLGGSNVVISAQTKHPNTAFEFAQFAMTNPAAL
ncbi:MAG: extracellular solute-binding protein, partial [Firmicutes bacterium]|nr:extracellular solute-binding protein [Bacillota bacterium]